jgi:hypothetical protein
MGAMRTLLLPCLLAPLLAACAGAHVGPPRVARAAGVDAFGTRELHPTRVGGREWQSTLWANGHARGFSAVDPDDPWFDAGHGDARCEVDGRGTLTASGSYVRLYVHDPARSDPWDENLEITAYLTRVSETQRLSYSGPQIFARTNHGTYTGSFGGETRTLCDDRGVGAKLNLDGTVAFEKETRHEGPHGYATGAPVHFLEGGLAVGKPLGLKYILRNQAGADGAATVHLELWVDRGDGAWTLATQLVDRGHWGRGNDPCAPGVDPALPNLRDLLVPASETGRPELSVYFRHEFGTMRYEKLSIREIDPLP